MYSEEIPKEDLKRIQKETDYLKWMQENPNASQALKDNAHWQYMNCDTFSTPVDVSNISECTIQEFNKLFL